MIQLASDAGNAARLVFFLFDLLYVDGEDIAAMRAAVIPLLHFRVFRYRRDPLACGQPHDRHRPAVAGAPGGAAALAGRVCRRAASAPDSGGRRTARAPLCRQRRRKGSLRRLPKQVRQGIVVDPELDPGTARGLWWPRDRGDPADRRPGAGGRGADLVVQIIRLVPGLEDRSRPVRAIRIQR